MSLSVPPCYKCNQYNCYGNCNVPYSQIPTAGIYEKLLQEKNKMNPTKDKLELLDGTLAKRMYPAVKVVIMDDLKVQYPEKFSGPTSVMDHQWFEADIRPKFNCFIRKDVGSIAFSFTTAAAPLRPDQAQEALPALHDLLK